MDPPPQVLLPLRGSSVHSGSRDSQRAAGKGEVPGHGAWGLGLGSGCQTWAEQWGLEALRDSLGSKPCLSVRAPAERWCLGTGARANPARPLAAAGLSQLTTGGLPGGEGVFSGPLGGPAMPRPTGSSGRGGRGWPGSTSWAAVAGAGTPRRRTRWEPSVEHRAEHSP